MNTAAEIHTPTPVCAHPTLKTGVAATIGRNTFFGSLSNIVQVATRLVTVPIVIQHLGIGGYGIWNIIMVAATYMRFGTVGIKTAYQRYVAEATGTGNYDRAARLLSTGCAVMFVLSVTTLIPAALLSRRIAAAASVPSQFLSSAAGAIAFLAVIMMMANVGAAFEAVVTGGHRLDIVSKTTSVLAVVEAVAIIILLRTGHGLFSMAAVMGVSEMLFITICYFTAHRVVPQIRLRRQQITKADLYELARFGGSYQLVNYLEVLYASIVPLAVLRGFGADSAGVYAVVTRVISAASVLMVGFGPTIVSGGTLVYSLGDPQRFRRFIQKTFKAIFTLGFLPLGFAAVFGPTLAFAWTGSDDPRFGVAFWLVSLGGVCGVFSGMCMILYRVAGRTVLDNARQLLRIAVLLVIVCFARKLGFSGTLFGLAFAEFSGMVFMLFALRRTFPSLTISSLLPDAARTALAAALVLSAGALAGYLPIPTNLTGRALAGLRLAEIGFACALVSWPCLRVTQAVTVSEWRALLAAILPERSR